MKKLLRDFLRLHAAGCFPLRDRAAATRRWTVTVPAPRNQGAHALAIDMHWQLDAAGSRPVAYWHRHELLLGA